MKEPLRVWQHHLLGIEHLSAADILRVLDTAEVFFEVSRRPVKKVPTLRGKTVVTLFYEASTRTRTSFDIAAKRLSADSVNLAVSTSSVSKGESLRDTVLTLQAMGPDIIVMRHRSSGSVNFVAQHVSASVVNAGDGTHEHPTQALLDAFVMRRRLGRLQGLKVAICGDVAHSRVARSNALLLSKLGADVRLAGPRTLLPAECETLGARVFDRVEPAIEGADVVMVLRIQKERLDSALLPSMREYARIFGINADRLRLANPEAIVMHPGPMNRGVEISYDLPDLEQSTVLEQVEAGVAVRMAVLYLLAAEPGQSPAA